MPVGNQFPEMAFQGVAVAAGQGRHTADGDATVILGVFENAERRFPGGF
jgi:hypothetical protein